MACRCENVSWVGTPAGQLLLRAILVESDSHEIALAVHESEAYKKARQALGSAAEHDFRIVEGA